jgi:hypothetical protein
LIHDGGCLKKITSNADIRQDGVIIFEIIFEANERELILFKINIKAPCIGHLLLS